MSELLNTPLFRQDSLPNLDDKLATFALVDSSTAFSLLSQGDHPILGTPCWYLHPCRTADMIEEVIIEGRRDDWSPEEALLRFFETWFMVLGNVIDFRLASISG